MFKKKKQRENVIWILKKSFFKKYIFLYDFIHFLWICFYNPIISLKKKDSEKFSIVVCKGYIILLFFNIFVSNIYILKLVFIVSISCYFKKKNSYFGEAKYKN